MFNITQTSEQPIDEAEYAICTKRGHEPSGHSATFKMGKLYPWGSISAPTFTMCIHCRTWYRFKTVLVELDDGEELEMGEK